MRLNLYLEFHTTTCNKGRCLDLLCTLQSTSREFFHSEPLDYLVAFLAKFALILTETGWFSCLYWRHSSQILKLNHPLPHLQPSVNVLSSCQECWRINTLTLKCDTGLKIPLEQKGEGHINLYGYCFSLVLCVLGFGSGSVLMLVWRFRILSNQNNIL